MSNSDLFTFPSNRTEALACLFVQKKQYDNPSPEELAKDYMDAYKRIRKFFSDNRESSNWKI